MIPVSTGGFIMAKIVLAAESGSDIPVELGREKGIWIVPMHVAFGDETKDDGYFRSEEVCDFYEKTGILPKTSGCNPGDFTKVFDEIHAQYPDAQILHLAYSAATTVSYNSALIAAEGRDYVTSFDTKSVAAAQYAIVMIMKALLDAHPEWEMKDALEAAEGLSAKARMCFTTGSLEFLRAGGRVNNAKAIAGKLFAMHPAIEIKDGKLIASKMYRGRMKRVVPKLIEEYTLAQHLNKDEIWMINTPYLDPEIMDIAEEKASELEFEHVTWVKAGGVITTHSGPGSFGVVGFSED